MLAGVSPDYYAKFEQGKVSNISDQVLNAIGRALRLTDLEQRHLRMLVRHASQSPSEPPRPQPKARASVVNLIHSISTPAILHGPLFEVLAMNPLAKALFGDFLRMPIEQRNYLRWMFLNPRAKEIHADWQQHAAQITAIIRTELHNPRNVSLERLVGELSMLSTEFAALWSSYRLHEYAHGTTRINNAVVGALVLHYEALPLVADRGQTVLIYVPEPGSPTAERLQLLRTWTS